MLEVVVDVSTSWCCYLLKNLDFRDFNVLLCNVVIKQKIAINCVI